MNYDKLIKFFFKECSEVVLEMRNSNHHYDEANGILNPYHLEGDVLTHTLMVIQQAEMRQMPDIIAYGALFHDFGKQDCREENHEKQRVTFFNHDAYSAFKSLYYMNKLGLSDEDKIRLFKMVALHTDLYRCEEKTFKNYLQKYKNDEQLIKDLEMLGTCDGMGRYTDEEISPREEGVKITNGYVKRMLKEVQELKTKKEVSKNHKLEAITLVGLPMSGKSSWIKEFLKSNPSYEVASRDSIIMELGEGRTYNKAYDFVDQKKVNELFRDRVSSFVKDGKNIIFDLTSMNRKSRRRSLSLLNKEYKKTAVVLLCDLKTLEKRNLERQVKESKFINKSVIDSMIKSFYPPMHDEFDSIEYIISK